MSPASRRTRCGHVRAHRLPHSLDKMALYIALKGIDFEVLDPPELRDHIGALAARLTRASHP